MTGPAPSHERPPEIRVFTAEERVIVEQTVGKRRTAALGGLITPVAFGWGFSGGLTDSVLYGGIGVGLLLFMFVAGSYRNLRGDLNQGIVETIKGPLEDFKANPLGMASFSVGGKRFKALVNQRDTGAIATVNYLPRSRIVLSVEVDRDISVLGLYPLVARILLPPP